LPLDSTAAATTVEGQAPQTDDHGGERRERRSRDRYGRDRRERGERAPREEGATEHADPVAEQSHGNEQAPQEAREPRQPREPRAERTERHAPVEHTHREEAAAQTTPARSGMPRIQAFNLPVADMQAVAQGSGLEWVNSNPERIAAVQAAIAAEPKPVHIPRERPPVVVVDEGPLVLVETRKDL